MTAAVACLQGPVVRIGEHNVSGGANDGGSYGCGGNVFFQNMGISGYECGVHILNSAWVRFRNTGVKAGVYTGSDSNAAMVLEVNIAIASAMVRLCEKRRFLFPTSLQLMQCLLAEQLLAMVRGGCVGPEDSLSNSSFGCTRLTSSVCASGTAFEFRCDGQSDCRGKPSVILRGNNETFAFVRTVYSFKFDRVTLSGGGFQYIQDGCVKNPSSAFAVSCCLRCAWLGVIYHMHGCSIS